MEPKDIAVLYGHFLLEEIPDDVRNQVVKTMEEALSQERLTALLRLAMSVNKGAG